MTTPPTPDAGAVRQAVLDEFTACSGFVCEGCEVVCRHVDGRTPHAPWMADAIIALRAEVATLTAQLAAAKADGERLADSIEDFIGAQGTAYEADQYLMLCGVVRDYNARADAARTGAR